MKKLNPSDPWFLTKFFGLLVTVSIVGVFLVGILEQLFGIAPIFYSFVVIIAVLSIILIIAQLKQKLWTPKMKKDY